MSDVKKFIRDFDNQRGKEVPALSLVANNPQVAAIFSKLVSDREAAIKFDKNKASSFYGLDQNGLSEISQSIQNREKDAENMMQLFPDLELAAQILISSILSPKDMVNTEIIYKLRDSIIPAELGMTVVEIFSRHLEGHYKFKQKLPEILREMLFESGAYVRAVIPESAIDEVINGRGVISTESLNELFTADKKVQQLGILGPGLSAKKEEAELKTGLESFDRIERLPYQHFEAGISLKSDTKGEEIKFEGIEVTDNFLFLKLPNAIRANNRAKINHVIGGRRAAIEAYGDKKPVTTKEFEALIYKGVRGSATPFVSIKTERTAKRRSVSRPLDMLIPTSAVLPVHVPGEPRNHIGYFVLLDEEGNPLSRQSSTKSLNNLQSNLNSQNTNMSSFLLQKARNNLEGQQNRNISIDQAAKIYSDIVESDLIERLRNGIYGNGAEISNSQDIYRIMLARQLSNQYTRLLYLPVELTSYFAYKYYDNGTGKSLLDDLKIITSLRSMLLFAKVMAMTKNSIALTHVNMTLDPNDPDPQKSIELSIHEIMKMRQQYFPLGINSLSDLTDWIQRAGYEFTFEGHPGIPQTKFEFETKNIQHTVPDSDVEDLLRKQTFMALGLSPETVDNGFSAEFATTVVANNILLSKRVLQIQEHLTPQLTNYGQTLSKNDIEIRKELFEALKASKGQLESFLSDEEKAFMVENEDGFLREFVDVVIEHLELDLPKPDITTLENQSQAFEHYSESLEKALDAWINSEFITETLAGDINSNIDTIKAAYKAYFLRLWMAQNGFMTELADIVGKTEDGRPAIDIQESMATHIEGLMLGTNQFIKQLKPFKDASNADLAALDASNGGGSSSSSDSGMSDSSDFGGDDTMGGMGDLDGLGDLDAAPVEPETGDGQETKKPEEENPPSDASLG